MSPKSFSSFLKSFRSKRDQARSASSVSDDRDRERGQSLQLDRHPISLQSGRSASTAPRPSTPGNTIAALEILPADTPTDVTEARNDTNDRKKDATSPQELWDEAYDDLKAEQPKLIQIYEVILSNKLQNPNFDHSQEGNEINTIETAGDERRAQMLLIIQYGQNKIKREVKIKESVGDVMEIMNSVKSIISTAVQTAPQAALPWSIVSLALEILQNPLKEQKDSNEGIIYTTKRMEWYWSLSRDLFHGVGSIRNNVAPNTQSAILSRLVGLYKEIMLFQIKSICSFYRNRGVQLFRDFVMIDNWKENLKEIRALELEFQNDYTTHVSLEGKSMSHQIKNCLERLVALQVVNLEQQDRDCLRDLHITNPRDDRKRLLDAKGGILPGSYTWVIESAMFQQWHRENRTNLLWIKGNPGKGKTMIICGLIEELEHMEPHHDLISYFFCQGTDPSFNNATAVVRSIIYLLAIQKPSLIEYVQQEYKNVGSRNLFDGINAWITLSGIFRKMLQDPALENACLIVDALDECELDRKKLLDLIIESTLAAPQVKWILSSRNLSDIESKLHSCQTSAVIDLESNATHVSESVDIYIRCRTQQLSLIQDNEVLHEQLQRAILQKSSGTFLWAALVFQEIEELRTYDDNTEVLQLLDDIPSGLIGLYERMMNQIDLLVRNDQDRCRNVLATMAAAYQPLSLETLPILAGLRDRLTRVEPLKALVRMCGSFLTIRGNIVYFVHQSAKDYLVREGRSRIFPSGDESIHRHIFKRSLEAMLKPGKLRPNVYSLPYPGIKIHEISVPQPDPLAGIQYCCIYWLQHFCNGFFSIHDTSDNGMHKEIDQIFDFFKIHFLHWIEVLSLLQNVQAGIISLQNLLEDLAENLGKHEALEFFQDAIRFILHNKFILETAPLQTYLSALIFAPTESDVRLHFKDTMSWIKALPEVENHWSPCQYTLYHGEMSNAVFSNDTSHLITLSLDGKMRKWDCMTGELIPGFDLDFGSQPVDRRAVTFSDDSKLLAISDSSKITVWDLESGKQVHEFKRQYDYRTFAVFSSDSLFLAVAHSEFVEIWDLATGKVARKSLNGIYLYPVLLSRDFKLAAGVTRHSVTISNIATGESICGLSDILYPANFSNNSSYLVSLGSGSLFQVWHIPSGEEVIRYEADELTVSLKFTSFSDDSKFLAFGDSRGNIDVWNLKEKVKIRSYSGHTSAVTSVAFSRDARLLVSGSKDGTVKVWATDLGSNDIQPKSYGSNIYNIAAVALSADGNFTTMISGEDIRFWNRRISPLLQATWQSENLTVEPFTFPLSPVITISKDSGLIAMVYKFKSHFFGSECVGISMWSIDSDLTTADVLGLPANANIIAVAFSPNNEFLAAAYHNKKECAVVIWRAETLQEIVCRLDVPTTVPATARFFVDDAYLHVVTDIGCYRLEKTEDSLELCLVSTDKNKIGYSIKTSNDWISWNGKDMIWLPGDFRPSHIGSFSARPSEFALGTALRGLIGMKFEEPPSEIGDWTPWQSSRFL